MPENQYSKSEIISLLSSISNKKDRVRLLEEFCDGNRRLYAELEARFNLEHSDSTCNLASRRDTPAAQISAAETQSIRDAGIGSSAPLLEPGVDSSYRGSEYSKQNEFPQLDGYRILNKIAEHGQGTVYRADHLELNRQVVVKTSKDPSSESGQKSIVYEGRSLASLVHPNIAQVYDLQADAAGRVCLVIEYIEGKSLADEVRCRSYSWQESVRLVAILAEAVQFAHDHGVLHRDLKPANVMIRSVDKTPKIIDFGMARIKRVHGIEENSEVFGGTIAYLSPEQARWVLRLQSGASEPDPSDGRSDVFALGAILYEMLTGKRLYQFSNSLDGLELAARCEVDPKNLEDKEVPSRLKEICLRSLAANPVDRVSSCRELQTELESVVSPKIWERMQFPISVFIPLTLTCVVAFVVWINQSWSSGSGDPQIGSETNQQQPQDPALSDQAEIGQRLQATSMDIRHFRRTEQGDMPAGILGKDTFVPRLGDKVQIRTTLTKPAYSFLICFRPDGVADLCYPENEDMIPEKIDWAAYPFEDQSKAYGLNEGVGNWLFVLIASEQPLPAFGEWKQSNLELLQLFPEHGWPQGVVCWDDGSGILESWTDQAAYLPRGKDAELSGPSARILNLTRSLRQLEGVDLVSVLGFHVAPLH